jgi:hypothetical protein
MDKEGIIDDFAIRSFRDRADEDYISARLAYRAALAIPSLWSSLQTIEKYLKCILLLNRVPCRDAGHNLHMALKAINASGKVKLDLCDRTTDLINHLDGFGSFRYLEISNVAYGSNLIALDRAVWELRRFCCRDSEPRRLKLQQGIAPSKFRIEGGYLEAILDNPRSPAREPLLWSNAFFGKRQRRRVRRDDWIRAENAPLYLHPEMIDEILKYVHLPKELVKAYRTLASSQKNP